MVGVRSQKRRERVGVVFVVCFSESIVVEDPRPRALVLWVCAWCGCAPAGVVLCVLWVRCVVLCALWVRVLVCVGMRVPPTLVSWLGGGVGGVLFLCGCVVAVSYSPTTCRSQYHWRYRA